MPTNIEDNFAQLLYVQGIISKPPNPDDYTDEDEDFEPIEIRGKPLSETINANQGLKTENKERCHQFAVAMNLHRK